MGKFDYDAPAQVYLSTGRGGQKGPVTYRRFARSADAIRFAVEELSQPMQRGTAIEVGDERFEFVQILDLYCNDRYPLSRLTIQTLD